jgi:D-sorbitol dehydrogenase (acceptor)
MLNNRLYRIAAVTLAVLLTPAAAMAQDANAQLIAKGRYTAIAADCIACHTAPKGGQPFAGGYVIDSPMGGIVASNITPSKTAGIGNWTEAQFIRAVRKGIAPGGHLYPAMPYTSYKSISDDDMHALWTYLQAEVKPVDTPLAQKTDLAFPFNQRWLMAGWNLLYAGGEPAQAADVAPGGPKRGEYLVNSLAHCAACHSPRTMLLGENAGAFLAGGDLGGWKAPNITSDPVSGIGGWSEQELVDYLRTGRAVGKSQAAGPMAEAVTHSLRHLDDADLHAMAAYLKTVKAVSATGQKAAAYTNLGAAPVALGALDIGVDRDPTALGNGALLDGQRLYVAACASCHQANGQGTQEQFYPSLTRNSATGGMSAANLVMTIANGVERETNDGPVAMPAFADQLSEAQIAAVSNYVMSQFGNPAVQVTERDVHVLRKGGEKPILLRATPYLMLAGPVIVIALIILLVVWLRRRRKTR